MGKKHGNSSPAHDAFLYGGHDRSSLYANSVSGQSGNDNERSKLKVLLGIIRASVIVIIVITLVFGSWYTLDEDEYGVVNTFGQVSVVEEPGFKLKVPMIQKVKKINKASRQFAIGYDIETDETIYAESFMITSDFNFVDVDFYFEYYINDPVAYMYASEKPEVIVKNLAQSYIRDTVGTHNVDEVLTTGKYEIQSQIKELLVARLEKENIGIMITNAVIQDANVPTVEVAQAFKNVEDAKQGMETAINNANADANTRIPGAKAEADKIVKDAKAKKEALIADAQGQVARFNSLYEEYKKFPLVTKERMFYETMETVLPNMDIYITDGGTETLLPLEQFSTVNNTNGTSTLSGE